MDFNSIDKLSDEEINDLFADNVEQSVYIAGCEYRADCWCNRTRSGYYTCDNGTYFCVTELNGRAVSSCVASGTQGCCTICYTLGFSYDFWGGKCAPGW